MSITQKRKRVTRTLAELVPGAIGDALAAQGFAAGEIVLRWPEIAGAALARRSRPLKLQWPRGRRTGDAGEARAPAVLLVQVESAFALELQMQAPVLIERVNRYFGWNCVAQLRVKQGPIGTRAAVERSRPALSAEEEERIARAAGGVDDDRLADALQRLGRAVTTARKR